MNGTRRRAFLCRFVCAVVAAGMSPLASGDVDCLADFNGDGSVNTHDLVAFLNAWSALDPSADYLPDGVIDSRDVLVFLNALNAGCEEANFAGDPNPNDFGEQESSIPGGSSACAAGSMAAMTEGWASGVYPFSGELHQESVDLRVRGRVLDFNWKRRYRSQGGPDTAQGNRWDFSYNIFLERHGPHLNVHNGYARADTYRVDGEGRWSRHEYFRVLARNPDGSYTLKFPDTGAWTFNAFDGSPGEGRLAAITTRTGNTMTFAYDDDGRLATVIDDLDRVYTIWYNAEGMIEAVCDFTGRCWTYEYYNGGETGGSLGDLKRVTSPPVVGTPTGNDFPDGKATVYTYSSGAGDDRLNHLLRTITDPKGQTYLRVYYDTSCDPNGPPSRDLDIGIPEDRPTLEGDEVGALPGVRSTCGRVQRLEWGAPGDFVDLVYLPVEPDQGNNFATVQVFINDREGHVKELFYNDHNRGVMCRQLTGLADPDQPTTRTANRPTGKLRPTDPDFFETRWTHNGDGLVTEVVYPNLNSTLQTYDEGNDSPRSRGNLLERRHLPGPLGGDQDVLLETFEYDDDFGGCGCGPQFVTRHVDFRGNETLHEYDDRGNRVHTTHRIPSIVEDREYNQFGQLTAHVLPDNGSGHRRRNEFTYYDGGDQNGRLREAIVDATGYALTTTYLYDAVGNVIAVIDPGGHDTHTVYNQLNQPVRTISAEVNPGSGIRYERDTYYDANNNVVRVDIQNRDDQGALQPNTHYTTVYEYDVLNRLVCDCAEAGEYTGAIPGPPELPTCTGLPDADFVRHEYAFDANSNRTLVRFGEAVEGRQPDNRVTTLYDERDMVFRVVRAPGHADQSTTQYDYDGNGNPAAVTQGLEAATDPKYPGDAPRLTLSLYDGFNRRVSAIDAMGNFTHTAFDANGNTVAMQTEGELVDIEGWAGNVRLSEASFTFDAMNRRMRSDVAFFDTATQAPILVGATPDGQASTETEWTDSSQVRLVRDDNLHETLTQYDTANRVASVTDARGNRVEYVYDDDSLVVGTLETDLSDLGNPAEEYLTIIAYDGLHRRVSTVDNVGNVTTALYDSRSNRTRSIDARGIETRHVYDGRGRLVATIRDLDGDGADGDGPDITTTQTWDDTSRLVGQGDDNGNVTVSIYDPLGRRVAEEYADCTATLFAYDSHGNVFRTTDANGSVVLSRYDLLNRRIRNDITPGPGVSDDTTLEQYAFDGLSRQVFAQDNDSRVSRAHDSLSRVTSEVLTIDRGAAETSGTTVCLYDGVGNQLSCDYPGGRAIETTYDALDRKSGITDQLGTIAGYDYIGRGRVERREYGNGTRTDYAYDGIANDPGDFGVRRIVRTLHTRIADGLVLDDRTFSWDPVQNKTERADIRAGGPGLTHAYSYDDADRLTHTTVTDAGNTVICERDYDLDGVGNREAVAGCADPGAYTLDPALCEPGDLQMNQYTATPFDARAYDTNGNLVTINAGQADERRVAYDYRNRMVEFRDLGANQRHIYRYDPAGRRIRRVVDADGGGGAHEETRYFYHAWQVIEEQSSAGATLASYVYGLYIDEVLNMRRQGADFYSHADDNYNVMAVTDAAGAAAERYEYQDYGQPADPATGDAIDGFASAIDNPLLFTGRRLDTETGWFYYRTRYLDPIAGRFTTRDTIGIWGDALNNGNGSAYLNNNPATHADPMGTGTVSEGDCPNVGVKGTHKCWICTAGDGAQTFHDTKQLAETFCKGKGIVSGGGASWDLVYGGDIHFVEYFIETGMNTNGGSGGGSVLWEDFHILHDFVTPPTGINPGPGGGGIYCGEDINWLTAPGSGGGGIYCGEDPWWVTAPGSGGAGIFEGELDFPWVTAPGSGGGGFWGGEDTWFGTNPGSGGGGFVGGEDFNILHDFGTPQSSVPGSGGGGVWGGEDFHFGINPGSGGGGFFGGEDTWF